MSDPIRFLSDGAIRELRDVDPTMTVLDYVREVERRTGTKEGCAEGDCGACSVVLGTLRGGDIQYEAVNSCLLFVPALDGKQLIVVEDLEHPSRGLHPVQRAMVDCHGSQCGFCTPGFTMSLFALFKSDDALTRSRINDVLAGNLCRCTGYAPIVNAAQEMAAPDRGDQFTAAEPETRAALESLQRAEALSIEHVGHRFFAPATLDQLAALHAQYPEAHLVAGGTDLGLLVTKEHRDLEVVISVRRVPELTTIEETDTHLEIGAAVTLSNAHDIIGAHYRDLGELIRRFGSVQIRNSATIGGNIASGSPIGDALPPLIALDASVVLRSARGAREVPLDGFFPGYRKTALKPGEFIQRVRIPKPTPDVHFRAYKVSKRFDQDISTVCMACAIRIEDDVLRQVRLCYGGMATTPKRAKRCEEALIGSPWTRESIDVASGALAEDFSPISDMRASAEYRSLVAANLLYRMYAEVSESMHGSGVLAYDGGVA